MRRHDHCGSFHHEGLSLVARDFEKSFTRQRDTSWPALEGRRKSQRALRIELHFGAVGQDDVAGVSDFAFDLYERAYTRFDLIYHQQLTSHLKLKFAVKNLTDPTRGSIYDRDTLSSLVERNTYHEGREFSLALTLDL
jgi:hypothetical protein